MRSKATAALMKLKEIDRKYKIKCSVIDEERSNSSLSDISPIDEMVHKTSGSGDRLEPIANRRLKLDIRMPEAHMERSNQQGAQETESPLQLVTIFNKPEKKTESSISTLIKTAEETEVATPKSSSLSIIEEQAEKSDTLISEDVPEVDTISDNGIKEITSIIDAEEDSNDGETYTDDFLESLNEDNSERKVETTSSEVKRQEHSNKVEDDDVAELVASPKSTSSDLDHATSEVKNAVHPLQFSSQSSSEERRRSRRSSTGIGSSGDSPSSSISKKDLEVNHNQSSEKSNSPKSRFSSGQKSPNDRDNSVSNRERVKPSLPEGSPTCRSISRGQNRRSVKKRVENTQTSIKNVKKGVKAKKPASRRDAVDDQLRSRVRGHVEQMMNEQRFLERWEDEHRGYHGSGNRMDENRQYRSFFKPLDLPNVADFKRPGKLVPRLE